MGNHYVGYVLAGAVAGVVIGKWVLSRAKGNSGVAEAGYPMILPPVVLSLPLGQH